MYLLDTDWILTPYRAAVHVPTKTAVIADPHLGYSDARRRAGDAVPMTSLDEQLKPLGNLREALNVTGLVVAGDLCEARLDERLVRDFLDVLAEVKIELRAIVPGNHDRGWREFRDRLPLVDKAYSIGRWTVVHGDGDWPAGRLVMGHFHPAWRLGGRRQPCYLVGPNRLVLPAFSRDAAGGAVNHASRWAGYQAVAIDGARLVNGGCIRRRDVKRSGFPA